MHSPNAREKEDDDFFSVTGVSFSAELGFETSLGAAADSTTAAAMKGNSQNNCGNRNQGRRNQVSITLSRINTLFILSFILEQAKKGDSNHESKKNYKCNH